MRGIEIGVNEKYITETCCQCGVPFALESGFKELKLRDGNIFYCPSGHQQHYLNSPSEQIHQLKETLIQKEKTIAEKNKYIDKIDRSNISLRGTITRMKKKNV